MLQEKRQIIIEKQYIFNFHLWFEAHYYHLFADFVGISLTIFLYIFYKA